MPLAVGEVEEHQIRGGHVQVLLQQAGIPHRPEGAVRGIQPEAAKVLGQKHTVRRSGDFILPGVVRRGQGDLYRPHRETLPNAVTHPGQTHVLAQPRHIAGSVVGAAHRGQVPAGVPAEVVVVAVGQQDGVHLGHVLYLQGGLHQQGHVEALQHRVDENVRPTAVDQRPRAAQPADGGARLGAESLFAKGNGVRRFGLDLVHDTASSHCLHSVYPQMGRVSNTCFLCRQMWRTYGSTVY